MSCRPSTAPSRRAFRWPFLAAATLTISAVGIPQDRAGDAQNRYMPTGPPPAGGYQPYTGGFQDRASKVIDGVPAYRIYHGCGPTSAGMVFGYWDMHGYSKLFPGPSTTYYPPVMQAMCSSGHFYDYSEPRDAHPGPLLKDKSYYGGAHASDCIGDFMKTSWYSESNYYYWSWFSDVKPAMDAYTGYVNTMNGTSYTWSSKSEQWGAFNWNKFVVEIDQDRPMILLVDTDGIGGTDHFVTAIGYRDTPQKEYACFDTWNTSGYRWEKFWGVANGQPWGIYGAVYFEMTGGETTDHEVPGEYETIQKAIDVAVPGHQVSVAPGTYGEALDFLGKAITMVGTGGQTVTTIDATGLGSSTVTCVSGEGAGSVLQGFTITGGIVSDGGGLFCNGTSPTVTDCLFQGNVVTGCGGGVLTFGGSPTFTDCRFEGNSAWAGGGLYGESAAPMLHGCSFTENDATYGGGVALNASVLGGIEVVLDATTFEANTANLGGGLLVNQCSPVITSCDFAQNIGIYYGGGAYLLGGSQPLIDGCWFGLNLAGIDGGGILSANSLPLIRFSTFGGNQPNHISGPWQNGGWNLFSL